MDEMKLRIATLEQHQKENGARLERIVDRLTRDVGK